MRRPRGPRYDEAPGSLGRPPTTCAGLADPVMMKPRAPWAGHPRHAPASRTPLSLSRPYACVKPVVAVLMRLFFRVEVKNPEHVPLAGAVLLVANHSSLLDPPLVGGVLPRQLSFLAKAELFRIPLFGPLIRRLNARPVRREGPDPGALRMALRVLEEDGALLIFPEGTRGAEGVLRPAKAGAGMLAVKSGAPVVPVYISGSGRAWPRGQRLFRPAKVTVAFGPPLRFDGGRRAEGHRRTQYQTASPAMMAAIARLKDSAAADGTRVVVRAAGRRGAGAPPPEASL